MLQRGGRLLPSGALHLPCQGLKWHSKLCYLSPLRFAGGPPTPGKHSGMAAFFKQEGGWVGIGLQSGTCAAPAGATQMLSRDRAADELPGRAQQFATHWLRTGCIPLPCRCPSAWAARPTCPA